MHADTQLEVKGIVAFHLPAFSTAQFSGACSSAVLSDATVKLCTLIELAATSAFVLH